MLVSMPIVAWLLSRVSERVALLGDRPSRDAAYTAARDDRLRAIARWQEVGWPQLERGTLDDAARAARADMDRATARYHALSAAAYPAGFRDLVERLRNGDSSAIDPIVSWLEDDHFCLYSGFEKQRILRFLARADLTHDHAVRLRRCLVEVIQRGRRQELLEAGRLARRLASAPFCDELRALATRGTDAGTRKRAAIVLGACERETPRSHPIIEGA
jgi:hypothetical protein